MPTACLTCLIIGVEISVTIVLILEIKAKSNLLKNIIKLLNYNKILINNIDINIITQKPKISRYSKKIKMMLSKICKININQINIKGKTSEKIGLIGREKAIASEVISSVVIHD